MDARTFLGNWVPPNRMVVPWGRLWTGRVDHPTDPTDPTYPTQARLHQVVRPVWFKKNGNQLGLEGLDPAALLNFVLLGFPSDIGVRWNQGTPGAAQGPMAIRRALASVPDWWSQLGDEPGARLCDAGDIFVHPFGHLLMPPLDANPDNLTPVNHLMTAQTALSSAIQVLLDQSPRPDVPRGGRPKGRVVPIVLGGGHEVAFGHGLGFFEWAKRQMVDRGSGLRPMRVGLVVFDAHADNRPLEAERGTSGTSFWQLFEHSKKVGMPFHCLYYGLRDIANTRFLIERTSRMGELGARVVHRDEMDDPYRPFQVWRDLSMQVDAVYVTVCMDAFAEAFAPGVSARSANGFLPSEFFPIFRDIIRSGKVACVDVAELSPPLDRNGQTANLAKEIIFEFMKWSLLATHNPGRHK